jgi:hypothetical protein
MRLVAVLYSLAFFLFSELNATAINGVVIDSETDEPIPFAHIVVGPIISLTNLDGEFVITPHDISDEYVLEVSVMGYELEKKTITSEGEFLTIYLRPSIMQLEEVTIMSGNLLMNAVFNRFHLNYNMSRKHLIGYYKENLLGQALMYYLAEGIVHIYVPPNIDNSNVLVNPIRTRKKVFEELNEDHVFLTGNASDMAQSSIWRKGSFLTPKNRKNYEFIYAGASNLGDKDVFIVEFAPKNSRGDTEGKIFIEEETMAIIKLEYHPKLKSNNFWKSVTWVEEYCQKEGMFELFRVSYNGSWKEYNEDYTYEALLVVNESRPSYEIPRTAYLMDANHSFFHEAKNDFSDSFWDGYNYIKLDVESAALVAQQRY